MGNTMTRDVLDAVKSPLNVIYSHPPTTDATILKHRSPLHLLFRGQGEAGFDGSALCDSGGDVLPHGGAVLEAVTRPAADQPHVIALRMPVDEEVAIGGVFVLANPRFNYWGVLQSREALGQKIAHGSQPFRGARQNAGHPESCLVARLLRL